MLGPVHAREVHDPLVAEIEAVLEHRRTLVAARTLMLHHVADQISKLATEVRDQITSNGKNEARLHRLEHLDSVACSNLAGRRRRAQLRVFIDQDRAARREIHRIERFIDELPDQHGTTLRDERGIGSIAANTLLCEFGDPARFDRESRFSRWCASGVVALSSGEGSGEPAKYRLDIDINWRVDSVLHIASVSQARSQPADAYLTRKAKKSRRLFAF